MHDWDARTYDRISDPQTHWGAKVLDRLVLDGNERVLDAACGTGRVSERLLGRLPRGRLVALDGDPAMIAEARRRLESFAGQVEFVVADLLQPLPIKGQVDAVFSTAAFHWIKDHDTLFRNLAAVLRPGGQLVAQCGGYGNIAAVVDAIHAAGDHWEGPWCYATAKETADRLQGAGFVDIHTWLSDEPTTFESFGDMEVFLEKVVLPAHLARMPEPRRAPFVKAVASALDKPEMDYVRLNIIARRE
jgi:trans-aconitate 2-methyltransferase